MKLTPMRVLRAAIVLCTVSIVAYLSAIWTEELVSDRFALTGVTFMVAGLVALIIAGIMGLTMDSQKGH